jgi:agmatine deiminase
VWIGWPSAADLWEEDLAPARAEVAGLIAAILEPRQRSQRPERVELLVRGAEAWASAEAMRAAVGSPESVRLHEAPIGDIWLRDTGPIFVRENGALAASAFRFNGWGGKYELPEDDRIASIVAELAGAPLRRFEEAVIEGGAIEPDGEGTVITTRQCLLNPNRNPDFSERDIEAALEEAVGAEKVIWLDAGLIGDHTDGHVDNLARFVAPGRVVCMRPFGADDPNRDALNAIRKALANATDAAGRKLDVIEIPSPGRAEHHGKIAPASHMNFYIANAVVVVPTYASLTGDDAPAVEALSIVEEVFDRPCVALDSTHLLTGGGSFHCITQQQPA